MVRKRKKHDGINRELLDKLVKERGAHTALDFESLAGDLKRACKEFCVCEPFEDSSSIPSSRFTDK